MIITKHINSIFNSNTYIIANNTDCWIVDIGDFNSLKQQLNSSLNVKGIFLTHSHFDHIYGLPKLLEAFPDCKIITNQYGKEALGNDKLNMSRYHDNSIIVKSDNIICCKDGDEIEIFENIKFHILETPGHCPSCLTYYTDDYIFTGDSYIPGIKVVTNLPKGNKIQAQESVEKIHTFIGNRIICPGHGEMITSNYYSLKPLHVKEIRK